MSEPRKQPSDAAKRQRAQYYRAWRKRNPGKATEYQVRYWERKARNATNTKASDEAETAESSN